MNDPTPAGGFQVSPARANHAIHHAEPQATATGLDAALLATLIGNADNTEPVTFARRDAVTGAHVLLAISGHRADVAWIDGAGRPGSGEALARVMVDMGAGKISTL